MKRPKHKDPEREDTCKVDFACGWNSCCDAWEMWDKLKDLEIQRLREAIEQAEKYLRFEGTKQNTSRMILSAALAAKGFLKIGESDG